MRPRRRRAAWHAAALAAAVGGAGCASGAPAASRREWFVVEEALIEDYARRDRPAMVVDIDDTLVDGGPGSSLRLALGLGYRGVPPLAGAPEALQALGERWSIVLLTARDDALAARTIRWLEANGFPRFPVVFSPGWLLTAGAREDFKRRAIERLVARGLRLELGIGDKPDDLVAYARCGLDTILLLEDRFDRDLPRALEALELDSLESSSTRGWSQARSAERSPAPWLVLLSRERCWAAIEQRLTGKLVP